MRNRNKVYIGKIKAFKYSWSERIFNSTFAIIKKSIHENYFDAFFIFMYIIYILEEEIVERKNKLWKTLKKELLGLYVKLEKK